MSQFTLTARGFGAWTNGIQVAILQDAVGDVALPLTALLNFKPWTITVKLPSDKISNSYRIRGGLLVSGPATSQITVDHSLGIVELSANTVAVDEVSFTLAPTFRDLAAWINGHAGWSATIVGQGWYPTSALNDGFTATGATPFFVPAEMGLAQFILNNQDPLVTMSFLVAPGALTALAESPLAGGQGRGTDAMASGDLTPALTIASTVEAHGLFIQSTELALQQLALAHCESMSTDLEAKWRILFAGINYLGSSPVDGADASGATTDLAITAATDRSQALDGPAVVGWNGDLFPNPLSGAYEQLGGLGFVAQLMGMWAGARTATPQTNKSITSGGLEFPPLTRTQKEALLEGGVTFPIFDSSQGRTKVLQAITTFSSSNPSYRNLQGLTIQHTVSRMWPLVLSNYVGAPLDLETGERIKADCAAALDASVLSGSNPDGFLTPGRLADGTPLPPWEGLTVQGDSTTGQWTIDVNAHGVGETDYIWVRTKLTPVPIQL